MDVVDENEDEIVEVEVDVEPEVISDVEMEDESTVDVGKRPRFLLSYAGEETILPSNGVDSV